MSGDQQMTRSLTHSYYNPNPYIPKKLSEIYDQLGSMLLWAPKFEHVQFPEQNIDSEFFVLVEGFALIRKKLGEERYSKLIELAAQAKALFAGDPDDANGKTDLGRKLLYEIEDIIQEVRGRRQATKLRDEDGEITGD